MNRILVSILITIFSGNIALAQTGSTGFSRLKGSTNAQGYVVQRGLAAYLGLAAGYTGYNDERDVEGAPLAVKVLGSYVTDATNGVFDFGFGYHNQTFSQNDAVDRSISTLVLELAARYQFENRWQLGPIYNQYFDKGQNYGANQADAQFGGLQLLREFSLDRSFIGRAGGRLMSSLNVNGQSVVMGLLELQIGWGGDTNSSSTASIF